MKVRDVMTVAVVSVKPETPTKEVAQILLAERIGGVPVVDADRLVGIVTRSDLLPGASRHPRTAAEAMATDVVCLYEWMTIPEAARTMARQGLKRAPVVRGTVVVGMVTATDLLRPHLRTDLEITADIEQAISLRAVGVRHDAVHITVSDGVVTLRGAVEDEQQRALVLRLTRAIDGVVDVVDLLGDRRTALNAGPERVG